MTTPPEDPETLNDPGTQEPLDPRLQIPEVLRSKAPAQSPPASPKGFGEAARAWAMAMDLVLTTIAGLALGWLVDYFWGGGHVGAITGLALGFDNAFVRLIRASLRAEAREQAARRAKPPPPSNSSRPPTD